MEEKYQQKLEEKKKAKFEKHKELVAKNFKEFEENRNQHLLERENFKNLVPQNKEYAHEKLEKNFKEKFMIPSLEEK